MKREPHLIPDFAAITQVVVLIHQFHFVVKDSGKYFSLYLAFSLRNYVLEKKE